MKRITILIALCVSTLAVVPLIILATAGLLAVRSAMISIPVTFSGMFIISAAVMFIMHRRLYSLSTRILKAFHTQLGGDFQQDPADRGLPAEDSTWQVFLDGQRQTQSIIRNARVGIKVIENLLQNQDYYFSALYVIIYRLMHETEMITDSVGEEDKLFSEMQDNVLEMLDHIAGIDDNLASHNSRINEVVTAIDSSRVAVTELAALAVESRSRTSDLQVVTDAGIGRINSFITGIEDVFAATGRISDLLSKINSITEKTRVLSINAAIEAARQGEQGRGFSIIAGEITKLASDIELSSNQIHTIMDDVNSRITNGIEASSAAKTALDSISENVAFTCATMDRIHRFTADQERTNSALHALTEELVDMSTRISAAVGQEVALGTGIREQLARLTSLTGQIRMNTENQEKTTAEMVENVEKISTMVGDIESRQNSDMGDMTLKNGILALEAELRRFNLNNSYLSALGSNGIEHRRAERKILIEQGTICRDDCGEKTPIVIIDISTGGILFRCHKELPDLERCRIDFTVHGNQFSLRKLRLIRQDCTDYACSYVCSSDELAYVIEQTGRLEQEDREGVVASLHPGRAVSGSA
jgi:methyl-accepting chemotaxis protein